MAGKKQISQFDEKKEHVWFDIDTSEMLRDVADKTGKSVTRVANELIRLIKQYEEKTEIVLKNEELPSKEDKPPLRFRSKPIKQIRIQL